jgi:hypothetical protein
MHTTTTSMLLLLHCCSATSSTPTTNFGSHFPCLLLIDVTIALRNRHSHYSNTCSSTTSKLSTILSLCTASMLDGSGFKLGYISLPFQASLFYWGVLEMADIAFLPLPNPFMNKICLNQLTCTSDSLHAKAGWARWYTSE